MWRSPAVADRDYVFGLRSGVGDDESQAGIKLSHMPFDLAHHSSGLIPAVRLILKLDHLRLHATVGWRAGWSAEMGIDVFFQDLVALEPDKTHLFIITVVSAAFLPAMDGIIGGIEIGDESLFVAASEKRIRRRSQPLFRSSQPLLSGEEVIFKATEGGLTRCKVMLFSQLRSQGRVRPKRIGVIAVLIAHPIW